MPITHRNSDQFDRMYGEIPKAVDVHEHYARVRIMHFSYTQVGEGEPGSTITIQRLPPGTVRLIRAQVAASTSGEMHVTLGHQSYERVTGSVRETVSEQSDYCSNSGALTNIAVNGGLTFDQFGDESQLTTAFKSTQGVDLKLTSYGSIPDGTRIHGYILFGLD
ncbi:MAG: hypothetical protein N0E48_16015 [Candidatus Thiodiazotropha endolucinida]|nr:hypothetical protein [Candidatus Thiodiazotropha taylori]MCW4344837.1 hypothetical protein [Candidatus Thiodiazotropha endolucinida]